MAKYGVSINFQPVGEGDTLGECWRVIEQHYERYPDASEIVIGWHVVEFERRRYVRGRMTPLTWRCMCESEGSFAGYLQAFKTWQRQKIVAGDGGALAPM